MRRYYFFILTALFSALFIQAASKERPDHNQAGSQQMAYPIPAYGIPELSPSPEGYVPFHMEHYGRHGSRWLLNAKDYQRPVDTLAKADSLGKLTPRGQLLLSQLTNINQASKGRLGELTPLGHRQHREIASRMVSNFPQLFTAGTNVDAKSTVVIRCILSMANEIAELQRLVPGINVTCDATHVYQPILAYNNTDTVARNLSKAATKMNGEFNKRHSDHSRFLATVFNDPKYVADSVDENKIFEGVFDIAVNVQSHDDQPDLYDLFTEDELYNQWLIKNAWWYAYAGNSPQNNHRSHWNQRVLLRDIIEAADTAMLSPLRSANLRFGHESIVMPLTVLLELNDAAYDTDNIDSLAENWRNFDIFPMASNIQIVFYRPKNSTGCNPDDVLLKVMLNEAEASLPLKPVNGNYYRWTDFRKYYTDKLDSFSTRFEE
ncbi:MAG: histidine-type phosphatase [Muribaculaceae bacterium]|nr:histidine-type phosphatase [Muribaculaceae bacterium]